MRTLTYRWRPALVLAGLLALGLAGAAWAAGDDESGDVTVPAGSTHEGNLYAFGETVTIDGEVTGDVVAAGSIVRIGPDGRVAGDLLAAAYAIQVEGLLAGDARGAAFMVETAEAGQVGGDLAAVGYSIDVGQGTEVGGDLLAAGYQLLLGGTVQNDLRFVGAALALDGTVEGDVHATVSGGDGAASRPFVPRFGSREMPEPRTTAAPGLSIGDEAVIGGTLAYTSPVEAEIPSGAEVAAVDYEAVAPATEAPEAPPEAWWLTTLKTFLALLILGLLMFWLLPRVLAPASDTLRARPAASLGYGLVAVLADIAALVALAIGVVVALVLVGLLQLGGQLALPILAATIVLGALLTFGFLLFGLAGTLVAGQCSGSFLLRSGPEASTGRRLAALALGLAVVTLLISLPWGLGGLVGFLISCFGMGAMVLAWWGRRPRDPAAPAAAIEVPPPPDAA